MTIFGIVGFNGKWDGPAIRIRTAFTSDFHVDVDPKKVCSASFHIVRQYFEAGENAASRPIVPHAAKMFGHVFSRATFSRRTFRD